jgi:excisionase family DNA binding protein
MADELSPSQVAARLGTTTRSVQRWISSGALPARRVGTRWRVASDAIVAFVAAAHGEQPPIGQPPIGQPPIVALHRVFVANRGEIAARIRRTCDRLGIAAVVPPPEGRHAIDLLDIDAVVRAAVAAGADALHPGFGFLAENADFARAVTAAGIRWVGPPPAAIRSMGDKAAARRLAASLGIPVIPGYDGADQADARLAAEARRIGWPLLVKPAAGGGGKGMHAVRTAEELAAAISMARREAHTAFGDDRLILERLIAGPRHVEIQVLFDASGRGVHLGERDCSIQRRHQKVLEETPSPAVDPDLRSEMGAAALRLAAEVDYVSAGTVEFLLDDEGAFHFLEMNTRLQVEHPVTELVTGLDLVAEQLAIAAGEPLRHAQAVLDRARRGHAVEVRLYAEDAEAGFLPATGTVKRLAWPDGPGIRVDAGIDEGDAVTPRFDPMLAKIVAHAATRDEALDRLTAALDDTVVLGLITNLRFLRWLVRKDVVRDGEARIDTLERIWPPDDWPAHAGIPDGAWHAAAARVLARTAGSSDPWTGGWRLNAAPVLRLTADDGVDRRVVGGSTDADGETASPVSVDDGDRVHVDVAGRSVAFRLALAPDEERSARHAIGHGADAGPSDLTAPMPGSVLALHASPGDRVDAGDPVVTLEAMKMEHVVAVPRSGMVTDVAVAVGEQVVRGQRLASFE